MKKALRLDDYAIKQLRTLPELAGKNPIGRGVFSAVFDGSRPDTVFKLTVDSVGYWFLNCAAARVEGKHFPKVIKNHGDVGEIKVGSDKFPVFLYEIERLSPLKQGSEAKKTASWLVRKQRSINWFGAGAQLKEIAEVANISRGLKKAIQNVQNFTCYYDNARMDMQMANFMERRNGDLVITDPLFDVAVYDANLGKRRQVCAYF